MTFLSELRVDNIKTVTLRAFPSFVVSCLLLAISLLTVWQILALGYIPETPANDLAKHIASILNFKDAFFSGQYLPRLQLPPASLPDLPYFQFYGSLPGYLSLPFLAVGCEPIVALTLGVLLIRWIGAVAIYGTGRLVGANTWASSLAGVVYLLTPYIISNFYGRVAVPEAAAHGVIAIFFYGVIRLFVRADTIGVIVTNLAIVVLSLAHPIFLLFGLLAGALFSLFLLRGRSLFLMGCVLFGGLLLAGFQWVPGFLYRSDFVSHFTSLSPFEQRQWTSLSGLIGLPQSLAEEGLLRSGSRLYLTPGVLTIPVLIMLVLKIREPLGRATLGCLVIFLIASYSPFNFWKYLPHFFWAVQFPYRLLAFAALLTSIGLCLTLKNLRPYQWVILVAVMLIQSTAILIQKPYSVPLSVGANGEVVKKLFASQDYAWSAAPLSLVSRDGWLLDYEVPLYRKGSDAPNVVGGDGMLLKENKFSIGVSKVPENFIRVTGRIDEGGLVGPYNLWVSYLSSPLAPLDGTRSIHRGNFSALFKIPNDARSMTIQCATNTSHAQGGLQRNCPAIYLDSIEYLPANGIVVPKDSPKPTTLNIEGRSNDFTDEPIDLWFATPSSPGTPLTGVSSVGPGAFSSSLMLPSAKGEYILVASRYFVPALETPGSQDFRRLSVSIQHISTSSKRALVVQAKRVELAAYKRTFKIEPSKAITDLPNKPIVIVRLPMAFSPMIEVTQNNASLRTTQTIRGLISVQTQDLSSLLVARFRWPVLALLATLFGVITLLFTLWWVRHTAKKSCYTQ